MFIQNFLIAFPLFFIIAAGFAFAKSGLVKAEMGTALSKFSFTVSLPILLFKLMSDLPNMPSPDWRIAIAYFSSCFVVFVAGFFIAKRIFGLDHAGRTLFGMAGIFPNNVQMGVPLAISLLGQASLPAISVIFSLNAFLMWTLVTIMIDLGRNRNPSVLKTAFKGTIATVKNPIICSMFFGIAWGLLGITLPEPLQKPIDLMANAAAPIALFAVGIGLTQYRIRSSLNLSAVICALKLCLQPLTVYLLCLAIGLPEGETKAACFMASLPVGVNVYIMAQEFNAMQGETASALLITTALSALTVPMILSLLVF